MNQDRVEGEKVQQENMGENAVQDVEAQKGNTQEKKVKVDDVPVEETDENPRNWPSRRKWINLILASLLGFVSPMASTIIAPGLGDIGQEFKITSSILLSFSMSIYMLGYAIGQLIFNPLTEVVGRLFVQHLSTILFVVFNVACAVSPNGACFIVMRLLTGLFGSGLLSLGAANIADMFEPKDRGRAMSVFAMGVNLGPVIGPIIAGFMVDSIGFRWVLWLMVILGGFLLAVCVVFLRETYLPIIKLRHKSRKSFKNPILRAAALRFYPHAIRIPPSQLVFQYLFRPLHMLFTSPICAILSLELGLVYGYLYLLMTSVARTYNTAYNQSNSIAGLHYIAFAIGTVAGLLTTGALADRIYKKLTKKYGKREIGPDGKESQPKGVPEYRLPLLVPSTLCAPIGLFLFGWPAQYHVHWIVPDIGLVFFGFAFMATFIVIQVYTLDAFKFSASAIGATNLVRCLFGAFLPLAASSLFDNLGLGWGSSTLAFISIALGIPAPFILWVYGPKLRAMDSPTVTNN
ncbi:transmembrane transporter [Malassezia pachydermatis]|uniref:Mfs multidrug n=1 Tax=Malassezia pachydermatis TaxID=77020 RepID=A0A0M8MNE4_9BASI|nr:mfs multidrug [Malassezia pachydermatis]KOS13607.1 mfs multidrug [Malassezia pachydermatis]